MMETIPGIDAAIEQARVESELRFGQGVIEVVSE